VATVDELLAEARSRIEPRPGPDEALAAQARGALLVDLRSGDERARTGVVPGSLHVPRSVLEWRADPACPDRNPTLADLEREVVLICAHGYSSSLAAATLRDLGFTRATDLDGGFDAWNAVGLPVIPAPPEPEGVRPGMGPPAPSK
jgi:rhodanese-related sulfurtransferase